MKPLRYLSFGLLVGLFTLTLTSCQKEQKAEEKAAPATSAEVPINKKPVIHERFLYTYVAKCQMRCAKVGTKAVRETINSGKIKTKAHWVKKSPCPFYAATHTTSQGKNLVIIFAVCGDHKGKPATKIVRVYDKDMKNCDCTNKKAAGTTEKKQ